jgi:hypothetical protein
VPRVLNTLRRARGQVERDESSDDRHDHRQEDRKLEGHADAARCFTPLGHHVHRPYTLSRVAFGRSAPRSWHAICRVFYRERHGSRASVLSPDPSNTRHAGFGHAVTRETIRERVSSKHPAFRRGGRMKNGRREVSPPARASRLKFLRLFPGGFRDEEYLELEREYKWETHIRWQEALPPEEFRRLLRDEDFAEIATRALRVEQRARYSMMFSFEKMALRDAVRSAHGAQLFAVGLYDLLHGRAELGRRFDRWVATVAALPRKQTRVLTWPLVTVFGFIAQPDTHMFLKPMVTRAAALQYGFDLGYQARPSWETYSRVLQFAARIRRDLRDLHPRDMIDIQSFIWIQGSDEYRD